MLCVGGPLNGFCLSYEELKNFQLGRYVEDYTMFNLAGGKGEKTHKLMLEDRKTQEQKYLFPSAIFLWDELIFDSIDLGIEHNRIGIKKGYIR